MSRIDPEFDAIRARGVSVATYNQDALNSEKRGELLDALSEELGADGRIRVLLHSIAFGNLKLIAPEESSGSEARERLAERLEIDAEDLAAAADELFEDDVDGVIGIATPPGYSATNFLEEEDMARTVHAMGTSLLSWTQELHTRGMFAADARVFGLTSEGNTVAWKGYAAVAAAKVALESVSRSIAVEMAHFGIRSNIIQAGVTDTPALRMIPGSGHLKAQARIRNPFGRLTTPRDVANVIYLLSLPEAAWVNGEVIRVDGGEHVSGLSR
jgi:NAD(P)-dependent dehydrogenase (short-subunit alcohol dehydrogenase family)